MQLRPLSTCVLSLLLSALPTVAAQQNPADTSEAATDRPLTLSLAKGAILEIRGAVGNITVTRSDGPDVVVTATRASGGTEPRVQLVKHEKGISICSVYESGNPKKPNECLPMRKGRRFEGVKPSSPAVHFDVKLPDGVDLMADNGYGDVTTTAVTGSVSISAFRGNISVADGGSPDIRTTVTAGNTDVTLSVLGWNAAIRHVSFTASGGGMRVRIPANVAIDYWISSGMPIQTPFKLERSAGDVRTGRLGPAGAPSISLRIDAASLLAKVAVLPRPVEK